MNEQFTDIYIASGKRVHVMPITKATLHYHSNTPEFSVTPEDPVEDLTTSPSSSSKEFNNKLKELITSFSSPFSTTHNAEIQFVQMQLREFPTIGALHLHFSNDMVSEKVEATLAAIFPIQSPSLHINHLTIHSATLRPDFFIQFIQDRSIVPGGVCLCEEAKPTSV